MKTLKLSLLATVLSAMPAMAQNLVLSSWLPPKSPLVVEGLEPWAADIARATEGRVKIRILGKPLGTPAAHFDMARDGVVDITYGLHSFTEDDRFNRARLGQFSFLGDDATAASRAFYDIYSNRLDAAGEHVGTQVLGLWLHGPGLIHNNKTRIETTADLKGLKIRVPGGYAADLLTGLGATSLFMSSPETYEKLSRGVIDGVTFPYEAIKGFNLAGHLKYTTTIPGGIYNTTWFMVINDASWNSIPEQDRAAIAPLLGAALSERLGKVWGDADAPGKELAIASGIDIHDASEALVADIRANASRLEAKWAESLGEGYDGAAALAEFRSQTGVAAQ